MQESKTPIYDALTEFVSDMLSLASKISDTAGKYGPGMPEERELALHKLLVHRAQESPAARYLIDALQISAMDGAARPIFGSWRQEVIDYKVCGKKAVISDIIVRGLPSRVGNHMSVVAMDNGTVLESGRTYDGSDRKKRRMLHVAIQHAGGVVVYYNRLGAIVEGIKPGVEVKRGQVLAKANNENGTVVIDARRNGRKIDAAEWCAIEVEGK